MSKFEGESGARLATVHRYRSEFDGLPISAAITPRGKELAVSDAVGVARRLFARHPVRALPVLDGTAYVGAVTEDSIPATAPDTTSVLQFAAQSLPTVTCDTPASAALAALDSTGGKRLVVLEADGTTYVGLVCLRGDRKRLCVAASRPFERRRAVGARVP